jgi:hypothetical protein
MPTNLLIYDSYHHLHSASLWFLDFQLRLRTGGKMGGREREVEGERVRRKGA